ncbi:MAG: hypothetical protein JRI23_26710, partial [Deltaproteobacteria bacterium]|nr:hypothetical protein [Deltaproteobacteria bacterium]MBW2535638.1 hypothetical protein [Deltaproteobacteria bacterium]
MTEGASGSKTRRWALALAAAPGVVVQLLGVGWAVRTAGREVDLLIALALLALGTTLLAWPLERCAIRRGRADRWAFAALLGPVGVWLVHRLEPRPVPV